MAVGGRLVIPVGAALDDQTLWLIVKNNQSIKRTPLTLVRFVPLVANRPE